MCKVVVSQSAARIHVPACTRRPTSAFADDAGLLHRAYPLRLSAAKMKRWNPVPFLGRGSSEDSGSDSTAAASSLETALIVINTPIIRRDVFATVWKNGAHASSVAPGRPHRWPKLMNRPGTLGRTQLVYDTVQTEARTAYTTSLATMMRACVVTLRHSLSLADLTGILKTDSSRTSSRETSTHSGTM